MPGIDLNALGTEFLDEMADAWPDTVVTGAGGVIESSHIQTIPFEEMGLPFGCVVWSEGVATNQGSANLGFEFDVMFLYVASNMGPPTALRTKVLTLVNAIWPGSPWTNGQRGPLTRIGWGDGLEVNQMLRARKLPVQCGMVALSVWVGQSGT